MFTCPAEPDCSSETFDADPDIAGIGVIAAFLISAWSSLLITSVEYSSRHSDVFTPYSGHAVRLDDLLRSYIRQFTRRMKKPWTLQSIQPIVLAASDQQLVTGLAIMAAGYIQHCTITQYHFDIVASLGGIAFIVYQPTLYALDGYTNRDPRMKLWRTILMTILFGMIIPSIFAVFNVNFLELYGASTQCVWDDLIDSHHDTTLDVLLSFNLILTIWAYIDSMRYLYPTIFRRIPRISKIVLTRFEATLRWIDKKAFEHLQSINSTYQVYIDNKSMKAFATLSHSRLIYTIITIIMRPIFWVIFVPVFTCQEVMSSHLIDIWRAYTATLAWTIEVLSIKQDAVSTGVINGSENKWGFGQILPLFLLILPAMSTWELFRETQHNGNQGGTRNSYSHEHSDYSERIIHNVFDAPSLHHLFQLQEYNERQRQAIEAQIGFTPIGVVDGARAESDISDRMYESKLFRAWAIFCTLGIFGGSTYSAIIGYGI
ncbi:hypothetical protein F5Y00DRAFT_262341 [Daldinia vernicosa]|uniref:uncharacterized protein n=1 Tax=Daldinia vernicosa TaxID=114800 RepID=UPI0020072CC2|nr:uncharacterized protein F5Y00DRAFT_262341 [Daldinia vernicosa]KAI0848553.1 hypothetical protein F5Y00DRAFT_262341 [Daldinia vernicosa]